MNLLQIRTRTVLIPSTGLLNAIPKLPNVVLNESYRQKLVVSMLEERSWLDYRTIPAGYSGKRTPYAGQTRDLLKTLCKLVSSDDATYAYRCLANAVDKALSVSYGRRPSEYTDVGADRGYPHNPQIFDHGVSYRFYKQYVHVVWLRPVLNMKEMSVSSYYDFVQDRVGDKKVLDRTIKELMETVPTDEFLSETNLDFLERCLCSTLK